MSHAFFYFIISFFISIIFGLILIPILTRFKCGQKIYDIGPKWHKGKTGTPTMGGFIFILSIYFLYFIHSKLKPINNINSNNLSLASFDIILVSGFLFGIIGFIDDFIKIKFKRNLGLTSGQKFLMQIASAVITIIILKKYHLINCTSIYFPILGNINLKILFLPFLLFIILGTVNSVNLTDGLDGLATGVTIIVNLFLLYTAKIINNDLEFLFSSVLGSLSAFFIFNKNPARVFMGDIGSLFLGGILVSSFITLDIVGILPIIGVIYVLECLSVIIQVLFYKFTKKRVFKMSPLHHHFEMLGVSENKIVAASCIITLVMGLVSKFLI